MAQEEKPKEPPTVTFKVKVGWEGAPQTLDVKAAEGEIGRASCRERVSYSV